MFHSVIGTVRSPETGLLDTGPKPGGNIVQHGVHYTTESGQRQSRDDDAAALESGQYQSRYYCQILRRGYFQVPVGTREYHYLIAQTFHHCRIIGGVAGKLGVGL